MDGDGIPDDQDRCPLVPGPADNQGCPYEEKEYVGDASAAATAPPPEESNVIISQGSLMILKKVHFEYNSDQIMEISDGILNEVADTIDKNPQLTRIHIEGHADQRGNPRYNLKLTQRRAAAVYRYLLDRGVPREKLSHQGYGAYCPINPQNNEAAWEENRRVEFRVVEVNGNATDVPTGCPEARKQGAR
jgi:OmpA-OmpF porin, OOP family